MSEVSLYSGCRSASGVHKYRGTSSIRNRLLLGTYSRTMPRVIQWT